MVENIYGEAVCTNFEDAECESDPMHQSDNECSSIGDGDSSNGDEIKKPFVEPALPAKPRVRGVESVEVVVELTPPAVSRVQDSRCAAGSLCGMKTTPLTIGCHVCLNCHNKVQVCLCRNL